MKAMLHEASQALDGVNVFASLPHKERVAVKNVNPQAVYGSETFNLNFYCGESEEQVETPACVIISENATEDEGCPGNALVDLQVDLLFPADSTAGMSVIERIEAASVWLWQMLHRSDLPALITNQHEELTCMGIDPSGFGSQRLADGRQRVHRYTLRAYCAGLAMVG